MPKKKVDLFLKFSIRSAVLCGLIRQLETDQIKDNISKKCNGRNNCGRKSTVMAIALRRL